MAVTEEKHIPLKKLH